MGPEPGKGIMSALVAASYYAASLAAVVCTLGLVILIHEFGHFILCKKFGVMVERFAFGFGPELLGVTHGGTRFSVCLFPLGGFVKPAGENIEEATGNSNEYFSQPWTKRLLIVAAGPAMNYLLAFVLFTGVVYVKGMPEAGHETVIGNMMTGFPADLAGLKVGDVILSVDGRRLTNWEELAGLIHKNPGRNLEFSIERAGRVFKQKVVARRDAASGRGMIGIMPQPVYRPVGFSTALVEGLRQCYALTEFTISTIASKIYRRERPDVAGPLGIVQMVSRAAHSGWEDLVFLMGLLSVAIGFFNILPIPLLDGGHGAMYVWEGLSGRKLTPNAMAKANGVGMVFLLSLLAFATYNDCLRLYSERRAAKPTGAVSSEARP